MTYFKWKISLTHLTVILLLMPTLAQAQSATTGGRPGTYNDDLMLGSGATSSSRASGNITSMNDISYRTMRNIRELINDKRYQDAANKAIKFIRSEDNNSRAGLEHTPYYKEAYNCLCVSSTGLGKVEYAMEACNKSLALTPTHWETLKSRATLYFMTKQFDKSLEDFKTALANAPKDNKEIGEVLRQNISVVQSKM